MDQIKGRIAAVEQLTDRITAFEIKAATGGTLPSYTPGAHVEFTLPQGDTRAYSLIDFTPAENQPLTYRIAVQREDDGKGGSKQMHSLGAGDEIAFAPPKNDFPLDTSAPAVLLAGGIGITPLISMATALKAAGQSYKLHFSGRSASAMAYSDMLGALCGDALLLYTDDSDMPLNLDRVINTLGDAHLYICGPRGMIDATLAKADAMGIPKSQIHVELFETAATQSNDDSFEVEVASTGAVYTVAAGQSIIEALEDGGVDVMYDCQRGDCGICQCDVISGTPDHRDVVLSEDEKASGKVMQICVSRSKSPRLVLDI